MALWRASPNVAPMRPLRALVIYLLFVLVGGALLAPCLYWLVQALAESLPRLASEPFHRYVNRSLLVLALVGLWPLLKALGARKPVDLGLVDPRGRWPRLATGFAVGFGSLAVVAGAACLGGARSLPEQFAVAKLASKLAGALATAAFVSVMEEILFRGGIFGGLKRILNWRLALVASSAVYALVHFLARTQFTGEVHWFSGLQLLPQMFGGFTELHALIPGFFNLTLAGGLLALAFQRTGDLYLSIGLHAGWIFWLKSYGAFTQPAAGANVWLWGSTKMIDGWLAGFVLAATLGVLAVVFNRRTRSANL